MGGVLCRHGYASCRAAPCAAVKTMSSFCFCFFFFASLPLFFSIRQQKKKTSLIVKSKGKSRCKNINNVQGKGDKSPNKREHPRGNAKEESILTGKFKGRKRITMQDAPGMQGRLEHRLRLRDVRPAGLRSAEGRVLEKLGKLVGLGRRAAHILHVVPTILPHGATGVIA